MAERPRRDKKSTRDKLEEYKLAREGGKRVFKVFHRLLERCFISHSYRKKIPIYTLKLLRIPTGVL